MPAQDGTMDNREGREGAAATEEEEDCRGGRSAGGEAAAATPLSVGSGLYETFVQ